MEESLVNGLARVFKVQNSVYGGGGRALMHLMHHRCITMRRSKTWNMKMIVFQTGAQVMRYTEDLYSVGAGFRKCHLGLE